MKVVNIIEIYFFLKWFFLLLFFYYQIHSFALNTVPILIDNLMLKICNLKSIFQKIYKLSILLRTLRQLYIAIFHGLSENAKFDKFSQVFTYYANIRKFLLNSCVLAKLKQFRATLLTAFQQPWHCRRRCLGHFSGLSALPFQFSGLCRRVPRHGVRLSHLHAHLPGAAHRRAIHGVHTLRPRLLRALFAARARAPGRVGKNPV